MVVIEPQLPQVVHGSKDAGESSFQEFPKSVSRLELGQLQEDAGAAGRCGCWTGRASGGYGCCGRGRATAFHPAPLHLVAEPV